MSIAIGKHAPYVPDILGRCTCDLRQIIEVAIVCLICSVGAWSQQNVATEGKRAIATVGGQPIYGEELSSTVTGQLVQLQIREYELEIRGLDEVIARKLLEAEAKRRGISIDKLQNEVDSNVHEPTDSEIEAFYLAQKDRLNRPLTEVRLQVQTELKQKRAQEMRTAFLESLRSKSPVSILLKPPRLTVSYDNNRVRGLAQAPVTIIEFGDFQCPYCHQEFPLINDLLSKYAGSVKVAFRDFPLRQKHSQAQLAAEAARCAGEQSRFWEFHDVLFSGSTEIDKGKLMEDARTLKLDLQSFESCLDTEKYKLQIEADVQEGIKLGVAGTPSFFVNGFPVDGAAPMSVFEHLID